MEDQKEYLTMQEVAELLKVSDRTVKNWVKSGILPVFKVGLVVRIEKGDLERFLKENTQGE